MQVIESLKALGIDVKYEPSPIREGDPAYLVADATKAKNILNWEPSYTNITDILKTAINWHKVND